ncbi:hypothetical protein CDSM653_02082 [Caldanaerobacter subterraneus subsp. pacificus DSM 12653]|uniref:Uncharacterized protein n=1 Tax=Caldanaerobacter subterraneus subsp. pacificus DSM 12653 TaxID=391606 RepID=A0A0F5PJS9_9THEO|nr:hypothetical protein CDSM653_02082 [Caldanaerobacter subterraneus subsp. pacificus DSM 12653]
MAEPYTIRGHIDVAKKGCGTKIPHLNYGGVILLVHGNTF